MNTTGGEGILTALALILPLAVAPRAAFLHAQESHPGLEESMKRHTEAWNAHNVETLIQLYDPDAAFLTFPGGDEVMRGRRQIGERLRAHFVNHPDLRTQVLSRIISDNLVFEHEELTGLRKDPRQPGTTTLRGVTIYQLRRGMIQRVWLVNAEETGEESR